MVEISKRSRSDEEQNNHDKAVKKKSRELSNKGYKVKADGIKGYERPDTIGYKNPLRPDIYASGHGWERIIEVETESSLGKKRTKRQNKKFRQWKYRKKNRKYDMIMAEDIL